MARTAGLIALLCIAASNVHAQDAATLEMLPWSLSAGSDDTLRVEWTSLGAPAPASDQTILLRAVRNTLRSGPFPDSLPSLDALPSLTGIANELDRQTPSLPRRIGLDPQSDYVNVYAGRDRTSWRERLPVYGRLLIEDVRAEVDLEISASDVALHHHVILPTPAILDHLIFDISGQKSLSEGTLVIETSMWTVREPPLSAWQEGPNGRVPVSAVWALHQPPHGGLKIVATNVDRALPLHLELDWIRFRSGTAPTTRETFLGDAVAATDSKGNVYTAANVRGTRAHSVVVQKFSPAGQLIYTTYIEGANANSGDALTIHPDAHGNVWVAGGRTIPPFPAENGDCPIVCGPFVTRLSPEGFLVSAVTARDFLQKQRLPALPPEPLNPRLVAVDDNGILYLAGDGGLEHPASSEPAKDGTCYVAKVDPRRSGPSSILYATQLRPGVYPRAMRVDREKQIVVGGSAYTDGPPFAAASRANNAQGAAFVMRIDPKLKGAAALRGRLLGGLAGGAHFLSVYALDVDAQGDIYAVGATRSTDEPNLIRHGPKAGLGSENVFVYRFDRDMNTLWSALIGGLGDDFPVAAALDRDGHLWISGVTESSDFPLVASPVIGRGQAAVFATRIDASGQTLLASTAFAAVGVRPDPEPWSIAPGLEGQLWIGTRAERLVIPPPAALPGTETGQVNTLSLLKIGPCRSCPAVRRAVPRPRAASPAAAAEPNSSVMEGKTTFIVGAAGIAALLVGAFLVIRRKKKRRPVRPIYAPPRTKR